jgi:hypothetical protein
LVPIPVTPADVVKPGTIEVKLCFIISKNGVFTVAVDVVAIAYIIQLSKIK